MIIDSSAILAVIGKEPGYEGIVHELAASSGTRIGAPTRLETGIVLTARFGPRGRTVLARFLQENYIQTVAFDDAHADAALDAYSRFGKGRHRAALNFGDCCTYAVASVAGESLLCVGDDFARTDLLLVSLNPDELSAASEKSTSLGAEPPARLRISCNQTEFLDPMTYQVTTDPGDVRRSAAYPDANILLGCSNPKRCDAVRRNRQAW